MPGSDIDDALLSAFDSLAITQTAADPTSLQSPPPAPVMAGTTNTTGTAGPVSSNDPPESSATPPKHLFSGYPTWDGDADSFENWLLTVNARLRDPGMQTFLGTPCHVCTSLFARIPASRQSECSEYIRSRIPDGADDGTPLLPFIVLDFIEVLKTAFLPKDIASRALQRVYSIRQGPAQPLALFMGEFLSWCTRAGSLAPAGKSRIQTNKMALNFTIRDAAATRGYASETDFDAYSKALLELATERELLPAFQNMKGSKTSLYVDVHSISTYVTLSGAPASAQTPSSAPAPFLPAPRMDRDGDTVMGGVNAMSTATDVATQIAALASQIAALQSSASGRRGNSSTDTRPYPPAVSSDVRQLRLANKHCERCDANPSHRWSDCQYRNFQSAPTLPGARRANVNNFAAASGNA